MRAQRSTGLVTACLMAALCAGALTGAAPAFASGDGEDETERHIHEWVALASLDVKAPDTAHPEVQLLPSAAVAQASEEAGAPRLRRVPSFHDETRVFWYAAGASAITSLAGRVLLSVPAVFIAAFAGVLGVALGPVAGWALAVGVVGIAVLADAALAALAGSIVYDSVSRFYDTSFLAGFAGHVTGSALSIGVAALTFGFGGMLLGGLEAIAPLAVSSAFQATQMFMFLGVMPAFVVSFLASVALPALIGTWALAVTARPKDGYVMDPEWRPLSARIDAALPPERRSVDGVAVVLPGS
jgi:hypothetical protein